MKMDEMSWSANFMAAICTPCLCSRLPLDDWGFKAYPTGEVGLCFKRKGKEPPLRGTHDVFLITRHEFSHCNPLRGRRDKLTVLNNPERIRVL